MRSARSRYAPLSTVANSPTMPVDLRRTDHSNKRKGGREPDQFRPSAGHFWCRLRPPEVVSGAGAEYSTVSTSVPELPAPSCAVTVMTLVPVCQPIAGTLHVVVPDAEPLPPRLFDQLTDVTPTLSDAVPPNDTAVPVDVNAVPVVGVPIAIDGGVVSDVAPAATDHVKVNAADWSTPSETLAVTEDVPAFVSVPEMNPVLEPMKSPGGRPVAV